MARFNMQESENYGAIKNNYFSLKDNGDTGSIRFLYNNIDDVEGVATHEVLVGDKRVDVECLRAYNEPLHKCPLCESGYKVNAKLFIPIYDMNSNESKIWTRGRTFFQKISSLCSRYNPLVSTPFEVERCGKKGDTNTTYELYPMQSDNSRIEDFPEIKAEGVAFQAKSYDDLIYYLNMGVFPEAEPQQRTEPRRNDMNAQPMARQPQQPARQTPAAPMRRRPAYNNEESF